jgi:hypothetical protein
LTVTGRPAQFGRGMIGEVSGKLLGQFATCLADTLGDGDSPAAPAPAAATTPNGTAPADLSTSAAAAEPREVEPAQTREVEPAQTREVEPVDLLRVAGGTATARRVAWRGLGALALAVLAWAAVRWLRR